MTNATRENTSHRPKRPEPIAFEAGASTIHGQLWAGGDAWAVLVHEPGDDRDLDSWRNLPRLLAGDGMTVLALDLPGHGLSSGRAGAGQVTEAIVCALRLARRRGARRRFLLVAGDSAASVATAWSVESADALVLLSPRASDAALVRVARISCPKLVLTGRGGSDASEYVLRNSRGWTILSQFGEESAGTDLFGGAWAAQGCEQVRHFLRDYR